MSQTVMLDQQITLGEDYIAIWLENFLADRKSQNLSKRTIDFYREKLGLFVDYCDRKSIKYISQITSQELREFIIYLEETGHNAGGISTFYRSIKTFLLWYEDEVEPAGWKNPIRKVRPPKIPVEALQGITREQFHTLLSACPRNTFVGERDRTVMMVLYDTGVRADELCNIRLSDVNLMDNSILVSKGKGRKPRFVFFGKATRKQIRRYTQHRGREGDYLFVNRSGDKLVYMTLRQIVRRLCEETNIKGVGLHDFRRAFCLECLRKGMAEITIARLMGHTTTVLIGRYAKQTTIDLMEKYRSPIDDRGQE